MPLLAEERGKPGGLQLSPPLSCAPIFSSLPVSVSASPPLLYLLPFSFLPSSPPFPLRYSVTLQRLRSQCFSAAAELWKITPRTQP